MNLVKQPNCFFNYLGYWKGRIKKDQWAECWGQLWAPHSLSPAMLPQAWMLWTPSTPGREHRFPKHPSLLPASAAREVTDVPFLGTSGQLPPPRRGLAPAAGQHTVSPGTTSRRLLTFFLCTVMRRFLLEWEKKKKKVDFSPSFTPEGPLRDEAYPKLKENLFVNAMWCK